MGEKEVVVEALLGEGGGSVERLFFFFSSRRRHTRFDCDWSSDVCSSDLGRPVTARGGQTTSRLRPEGAPAASNAVPSFCTMQANAVCFVKREPQTLSRREIGRASCRERV